MVEGLGFRRGLGRFSVWQPGNSELRQTGCALCFCYVGLRCWVCNGSRLGVPGRARDQDQNLSHAAVVAAGLSRQSVVQGQPQIYLAWFCPETCGCATSGNIARDHF